MAPNCQMQKWRTVEWCNMTQKRNQIVSLDLSYVKAYHQSKFVRFIMQTLSASNARTNLYRLIDEAAASHEPLVITGKRNNAVLVSQEDWAAMQETLFLLSIPNMRESLRDGMSTPASELSSALDW